jgi:hypothetical protein
MAAPSSSAAASASQTQAPAAVAVASPVLIPSEKVLLAAAKIAIEQDKPIYFDYYADTANNKAFMGEDSDTKEKLLIKSTEDFTSLVIKVWKVEADYLVMTENSIYIVSGKIQRKRVHVPALRGY